MGAGIPGGIPGGGHIWSAEGLVSLLRRLLGVVDELLDGALRQVGVHARLPQPRKQHQNIYIIHPKAAPSIVLEEVLQATQRTASIPGIYLSLCDL